jgi:hypothetical protein
LLFRGFVEVFGMPLERLKAIVIDLLAGQACRTALQQSAKLHHLLELPPTQHRSICLAAPATVAATGSAPTTAARPPIAAINAGHDVLHLWVFVSGIDSEPDGAHRNQGKV